VLADFDQTFPGAMKPFAVPWQATVNTPSISGMNPCTPPRSWERPIRQPWGAWSSPGSTAEPAA
jgi:hypothetical protein